MGIRNFELATYVALESKEPITESEYRELVEKDRVQFVPVDELAQLLERHEEWSEDDPLWLNGGPGLRRERLRVAIGGPPLLDWWSTH